MGINYVLDTNVVSEPLRPEPNGHLLQRLQKYQGQLAIPAIVWHELRFGVERLEASKKRTSIERYLTRVVAATLPVLPYDAPAAAWHATARARLSAVGKTPPFADGQIAATVAVNELILVTANISDFADFGISLENWMAP